MNQYAPLPLRWPLESTTDFRELLSVVQVAALKAFRLGSYDIDVVTDLVRRERGIELGFDYFYNFMAHEVGDTHIPPEGTSPARVVNSEPHRQVGPRFDIKVREGAEMPIVLRTDPSLVSLTEARALLMWFDDELHRGAKGGFGSAGDVLGRCADVLGRRAPA